MIATLTINPCLDKYIRVAGLEPNETNRSQPVRRYAGGKGIDVSRAIHEMGGVSTAFGFIGGYEGRTLATLLSEEGVPFKFVSIADETRSCYIIDDSKTGLQTRISTPGPRIRENEMNKLLSKLWKLEPEPSFLVCGGSVPPGLPLDIYASVIDAARGHNLKAILDSSGEYLKEGVKARPYLIKPNVHEAEELLGEKLGSTESIIQAGHEMVRLGVEIAVISRARAGLIAVSGKEIVIAVPPQVEVSSTVGAGDCTVAGLALKLSAGESLTEACRLAAAMGTAAVLTPGTELARKVDVERLLPQIRIEAMAA